MTKISAKRYRKYVLYSLEICILIVIPIDIRYEKVHTYVQTSRHTHTHIHTQTHTRTHTQSSKRTLHYRILLTAHKAICRHQSQCGRMVKISGCRSSGGLGHGFKARQLLLKFLLSDIPAIEEVISICR